MKKYKSLLIVILIFAIIGLVFTWPIILHLNSYIYANHGDPFGTIHSFWKMKTEPINYNFPNTPIYTFFCYFGIKLFGEIITYNLFILFSFILTGLAGYILAKKIFVKPLVAFFVSLVITISPFRLAHSLQHLNFADLSSILFFLYFLISAKENPSFKNVFLTGLFFIITTLWNYQYGFFAGIILLTYLLFLLITAIVNKNFKFNKKIIYSLAITSIFAIIIISAFNFKLLEDYFAIRENKTVEVAPIRSSDELRVYSAHYSNYLLPSSNNPIFGKFTKEKYNEQIAISGSNVTEQSLYLGWVVILLAVLGILQIANLKAKSLKLKANVLFFILLGLFGFYFSFAPQIHFFGLTIKTPAHYIFDYLPFFRVYARFGLLVIISSSIIAGFGLSNLLSLIKSKKGALLLYFLVIILLIAEFANFSPKNTIDVSCSNMPEIYKSLQNQSKGLVAEYPLLSTEEPKSYDYSLWARCYQFPTIYGADMNTPGEKFRKTVLDPQDQKTIKLLKSVGAKYLIIHADKYNAQNAIKYPLEYNLGKLPIINTGDFTLISSQENNFLYKVNY